MSGRFVRWGYDLREWGLPLSFTSGRGWFCVSFLCFYLIAEAE